MKHWDTVDTPINRIRSYLSERAWWDETQEKEFRSSARGEILRGFREAENTKLPNPLLVSKVFIEIVKQLIVLSLIFFLDPIIPVLWTVLMLST